MMPAWECGRGINLAVRGPCEISVEQTWFEVTSNAARPLLRSVVPCSHVNDRPSRCEPRLAVPFERVWSWRKLSERRK